MKEELEWCDDCSAYVRFVAAARGHLCVRCGYETVPSEEGPGGS